MDEEQVTGLRDLRVQIRGCRPIILDQKAHEPLHAYAYRTADAARAKAVPSSSRSSERPVLTRDPALLKFQDILATTGSAAMVLLAVVEVAVLFVLCRSALGTTVS